MTGRAMGGSAGRANEGSFTPDGGGSGVPTDEPDDWAERGGEKLPVSAGAEGRVKGREGKGGGARGRRRDRWEDEDRPQE